MDVFVNDEFPSKRACELILENVEKLSALTATNKLHVNECGNFLFSTTCGNFISGNFIYVSR